MAKKDANEKKIGDCDDRYIEVLTPSAMGNADRLTIERGTPGYQLMLAAGQAVADHALRRDAKRILVLAGPGNNGGDGLVAARLLAEAGRHVDVAVFGKPENLTGDAALARDDYHGPVRSFTADTAAEIEMDADLIIDALFGAGLARGITGGLGQLIEKVNLSGVSVLAVDLPSGVDGTTGQIAGQAINADLSVTFFRLKPGHLLFPGRARCGMTHLAQIGMDETALADINSPLWLNVPALWEESFPQPDHETHKYRRGHTLVVSGPRLNTGASRLAAGAALRIGSGLVTVAADREAADVQAAHLTAVMIRQCENADELSGHLSDSRFSSVVIGPAAGVSDLTKDNVLACLDSGAAVVLDADALTVFADAPEVLFANIGRRRGPVVLTPHSGEFARLFRSSSGESRISAVVTAAKTSGAVIVLKGADTIVAGPAGQVAIADNAPAWLATAGSGDVLAGAVGGLLAQKMPAFQAASAAVWLHGEAGRDGGPGLIADDLPNLLQGGLRRLYVSQKTAEN